MRREGEGLTRILVYGGWFGSGNLGDDAILIGLRSLLLEAIPGVEVAALSTDVEQTKRVCGVEAFPLRSPRELLAPYPKPMSGDYCRVFSWADACILSGGTSIYDYGHLSRVIHWGLPWILGREFVCFGIGVKPIQSLEGRWIVRSLLERAAAVSTRDRRSMAELKAIGVKREIKVTGDSALFLTPRTPDENTLHELGITSDIPYVAICPRALSVDHRAHYHAPLSTEVISRIRRNLAIVGDHLSKSGCRVAFIPLHRAPSDDDTAEIALIRNMMREPSLAFERVFAPEILAGLLGRMELVVGLRLHSLILAAAMGVPVVSIDYDPKIAGFMEYAGMEEFMIEPIETAYTLIERADEGLSDRTNLRRRLLDSCGGMRRRMKEEVRRFLELL
jgi:polysaccharide pyruvyl transferase WcaK-like protein